jgi:hypothetical protein
MRAYRYVGSEEIARQAQAAIERLQPTSAADIRAWEVWLEVRPDRVAIVSVTNQSTGYCPEPDCWPAVRDALAGAGLAPPRGFTYTFRYRRCPTCRGINILKDEMPECPSCGTELPAAWNLED